MAKQNAELLAFNRGLVSPLALARVDVKRVAMSAEEMVNWMPRVLGAMSLRAGLAYVGNTLTNLAARILPFQFAVNDTALLELTSGALRVWVNDVLVTRVAVASAVVNGAFNTDLASWTNSDEAGCTSAWAAGGYMSLTGSGTNAAIRDQQVTVAVGDQNKEHALRVTIFQGECYLRVGSTAGGAEYVSETFLLPGVHSLTFIPTGNFHIRIFSREAYPTLVDSINVEAAGVLSIPTPWTTAAQLSNVRSDQSGDVVFVACEGVKQKRIERRSTTSWSVVDYITDDGPFLAINVSPTTLTASALAGAITLTASKPLFTAANVGSLFKLTSVGQDVTGTLASADVYTDPIRITGVGTDRAFTHILSGTWVANIVLQRSIGDIGAWTDVATYTANGTVNFNDGFDNQIIYYRLGIKAGGYTSGSATARMSYASGSITGWARVTGFTSSTVVSASVLKALGSTVATKLWYEGAWSDRRGYPSAVALHEGRLWWSGKDKAWGSIVDAFNSFDETFEGAAGPISRSIGSGPVDSIRWAMSGTRLLLGAQGAEWMCRSSSLDEPLTPTNFNIKPASTRGSAAVSAVSVDHSVIFVDRSAVRIHELSPDAYGNHAATELSTIIPEIGLPSIVRIAVQRQPDTRIHFVRSDGKVAVLVYDKNEDVKCWLTVETPGVVEDVVVLPGTIEDQVYYVVQRTVGAATVRFLEKWALSSECVGGTLNKQADAFVTYAGAPTVTIPGLTHLEGATVVCWADGLDQGAFVVTAGAITLPSPVSNAVVGLAYRARFKGTKLAYAAQAGSALTQRQRVDHLGLVLADTHYQGLKYGTEYAYLDDLPLMEQGTATPAGTVWAQYSADSVEVNGSHTTDTRLCLEANAPRPCTILGAVVSIATHDKI